MVGRTLSGFNSILCLIPGLSLRSNTWLKLANASGVIHGPTFLYESFAVSLLRIYKSELTTALTWLYHDRHPPFDRETAIQKVRLEINADPRSSAEIRG